jgi:hypothetical protein
MKVSDNGKWYWRVDYVGNGLACVLAWAVIWALVASLATTKTVHVLAYVFLGWVIGWVSATIARAVYPAPRSTLLTRERRSPAAGS